MRINRETPGTLVEQRVNGERRRRNDSRDWIRRAGR